MKAISIIQPWPWLIIHAGQDVANRNRPCHYRGPVAIQASSRRSREKWWDAYEFTRRIGCEVALPELEELHYGAIVATARLVDCTKASQSRWFAGVHGLVLADVRPLAVPELVKGDLGLWDWTPAPAVIERLRAEGHPI